MFFFGFVPEEYQDVHSGFAGGLVEESLRIMYISSFHSVFYAVQSTVFPGPRQLKILQQRQCMNHALISLFYYCIYKYAVFCSSEGFTSMQESQMQN